MALFKPKQIDLDQLGIALAVAINGNETTKDYWLQMLGAKDALSKLFSLGNNNIEPGQTSFIVDYAVEPRVVDVFRNGARLTLGDDYTVNTTSLSSFTVILMDPVGPSPGAVFSEEIEITYY